MDTQSDPLVPKTLVHSRFAAARLFVGFIQGILMLILYQSIGNRGWPASAPYVFVPLVMLVGFIPPLVISCLGHLSLRQTLIWSLVAGTILAALGIYYVYREPGMNGLSIPSAGFLFICGFGLFIAHSLVKAGSIEGRWIASYAAYFETSWTLLVQLLFAQLFSATLWTIIFLGGLLFVVLGSTALPTIIMSSWFYLPVSCFAFACGLHLTDVRPGIVRGIRSLLLSLMSWILPVAVLIVAGFLLFALFNGLTVLLNSGAALPLSLGTTGILIVLINTAFQNGETGLSVPRLIRWSAQLGALTLLPLSLIGVYALTGAVAEQGWTHSWVIVAAVLLVVTIYGLGYGWAALPFHRGGWLIPITQTNVANALLILVIMLSLLSPLADPARLSVNDQVARLSNGRVDAEHFDFRALNREGARYGKQALQDLMGYNGTVDAPRIRVLAREALENPNAIKPVPPMRVDIAENLRVWPKGSEIPAGVLQQNWNIGLNEWRAPLCLKAKGNMCDIFTLNVSGEDRRELLVVGEVQEKSPTVLAEAADGSWFVAGELQGEASGCDTIKNKLLAGEFKTMPSKATDVDVDGTQLAFVAGALTYRCK